MVTITVQAGRSGDIGTGVVLDKDGHILTNNHVVEAAGGVQQRSITVTFHNGTTAKATVVGTSETNDLAVIKVDGVSDLTPASFAKSDSSRGRPGRGGGRGTARAVRVGDQRHRLQHRPAGPVGQTTMTRSISPCRPMPRSTPATRVVRWST